MESLNQLWNLILLITQWKRTLTFIGWKLILRACRKMFWLLILGFGNYWFEGFSDMHIGTPPNSTQYMLTLRFTRKFTSDIALSEVLWHFFFNDLSNDSKSVSVGYVIFQFKDYSGWHHVIILPFFSELPNLMDNFCMISWCHPWYSMISSLIFHDFIHDFPWFHSWPCMKIHEFRISQGWIRLNWKTLPGSRLRDIQRWSALIQNTFRSVSALFIIWKSLNSADSALNSAENGNFQSSKSALKQRCFSADFLWNSADSELNSADFLWNSAEQRRFLNNSEWQILVTF